MEGPLVELGKSEQVKVLMFAMLNYKGRNAAMIDWN